MSPRDRDNCTATPPPTENVNTRAWLPLATLPMDRKLSPRLARRHRTVGGVDPAAPGVLTHHDLARAVDDLEGHEAAEAAALQGADESWPTTGSRSGTAGSRPGRPGGSTGCRPRRTRVRRTAMYEAADAIAIDRPTATAAAATSRVRKLIRWGTEHPVTGRPRQPWCWLAHTYPRRAPSGPSGVSPAASVLRRR